MTNSKQTLRLYGTFMGRKLMDVPDHSTIAINIYYTPVPVQKGSKAGIPTAGDISLERTDKDGDLSR